MKLIKIIEDKNISISNKINDFKNPKYIYIPVSNSEYKIGDYIYKNEIISNTASSISGKIIGIKKVIINNIFQESYVIENDFKENIKIKSKKVKVNNKDELIELLELHTLNTISAKLKSVADLKNFVITCIDEECYSINQHIRLTYDYNDILDTIDKLLNLLNIKKAILATKNTNYKSIKNVKSVLGTYPNIKLILVPDKYLISRPNFLSNYLNLCEKDTLFLDVNELYEIYNILCIGRVKVDNLVTISGTALKKSIVINCRNNTSLQEIISEYVDLIYEDYDVYLNGLLGGIKIEEYKNLIFTKKIHTIIFNKKEVKNATKCINCGACKRICPVNISVKKCYFKNLIANNCINCGLCNYICPAQIDLKNKIKGDNNEKL